MQNTKSKFCPQLLHVTSQSLRGWAARNSCLPLSKSLHYFSLWPDVIQTRRVLARNVNGTNMCPSINYGNFLILVYKIKIMFHHILSYM